MERGLDDDGNVKATVDFRGVFASLLEQWLGMDAAAVPGAGSLARAALLTCSSLLLRRPHGCRSSRRSCATPAR